MHVVLLSSAGGGLLILLVVVAMYFVPGLIASSRGHSSAASVWVINIFLGWTFIGWVVALAMAVSGQGRDRDVWTCPNCNAGVSEGAHMCQSCGKIFDTPRRYVRR